MSQNVDVFSPDDNAQGIPNPSASGNQSSEGSCHGKSDPAWKHSFPNTKPGFAEKQSNTHREHPISHLLPFSLYKDFLSLKTLPSCE
ncbi:hypothetical protein RJT34_31254 [Clitoria ternatea]|uniref:Uncharacterized protein n=1 Tax=Clitoria ternatea TaxID=43366 RepID=A0AAN9EW07_CLITE